MTNADSIRSWALESADVTAGQADDLHEMTEAAGIRWRPDVQVLFAVLAKLEGESRGLAAAMAAGLNSNGYSLRTGRRAVLAELFGVLLDELCADLNGQRENDF